MNRASPPPADRCPPPAPPTPLGADTAEFIDRLAHDLSSPITTMMIILGLLRGQPGERLDDASRDFLRRGVVAGERALRLVDGLREWAQVVTTAVAAEPVPLTPLLHEVRSQLALQAPQPTARRVEWRLAELPVVRGDPVLLRRAFVELLGNAIKFSAGRDPAVIEVGLRQLPGMGVQIWVRDNGVGFDCSRLDTLFIPFRRLHLPQEFSGEGLGLAMVKAIAERHGGTVHADTREGEWAEFGFSLPQ